MTAATHAHREAFCHMLYRADDGSEEEWIWNSRDGVTPFVVTLRSGKPARHVEWNRDRYDPEHVPQPGERIFVDLVPEKAIERRRAFVERWWDDPAMPMREHLFLGPMGKEGAARELALCDLDPSRGFADETCDSLGLPRSTEQTATPDLIEVPDGRA